MRQQIGEHEELWSLKQQPVKRRPGCRRPSRHTSVRRADAASRRARGFASAAADGLHALSTASGRCMRNCGVCVAARNQNHPSSQSARFPAQIRRPRIQPPAHAGCKRACNQPSQARPDRPQAHIACKRRPGPCQIGSPARSICSRSCAARPTSSAFLNSALISTGLASNCSARSLMR